MNTKQHLLYLMWIWSLYFYHVWGPLCKGEWWCSLNYKGCSCPVAVKTSGEMWDDGRFPKGQYWCFVLIFGVFMEHRPRRDEPGSLYWVSFSYVLNELFRYIYCSCLLFLEYWWNMDQPQWWLAGVSKRILWGTFVL